MVALLPLSGTEMSFWGLSAHGLVFFFGLRRNYLLVKLSFLYVTSSSVFIRPGCEGGGDPRVMHSMLNQASKALSWYSWIRFVIFCGFCTNPRGGKPNLWVNQNTNKLTLNCDVRGTSRYGQFYYAEWHCFWVTQRYGYWNYIFNWNPFLHAHVKRYGHHTIV